MKVNCLSWSSRGYYLLSGSDDQHLSISDPFSGRVLLRTYTPHRANIFAAVFVPECGDRRVVSCSSDGLIVLTDLERAPNSVWLSAMFSEIERRGCNPGSLSICIYHRLAHELAKLSTSRASNTSGEFVAVSRATWDPVTSWWPMPPSRTAFSVAAKTVCSLTISSGIWCCLSRSLLYCLLHCYSTGTVRQFDLRTKSSCEKPR